MVRNQSPCSPSRSICDVCQHQLSWWQLIPLIGFLLQRGRCYWCHSSITWFLPLTEFVTLITAYLALGSSWSFNLIIIITILTLAFLASTDYFSQTIYPLSLLGLLPLMVIFHQQINLCLFIELTVILLFLLMLQWLTKGLGTGDIEFIIITALIWGGESTAQIVLIGCSLTLIPAIIKRGHRQPLIPGLALSFILKLVLSLNWFFFIGFNLD